jgi:hypothetical protein
MEFKKLKDYINTYKDGGTKGETADGSKPDDPELYARVKREAKKKFKGDWPSAYGSAWLVKEYKSRGGGYK